MSDFGHEQAAGKNASRMCGSPPFFTQSESEQGMGEKMKKEESVFPEVNTKLIDAVYRLRNITRFSSMPFITPNLLVEHCYTTGNLFVEIAKAQQLFVSMEEVLFVFRHDLLETVTGDILRPAKKQTPVIEKAWTTIEEEIVHKEEFSWLQPYTDTWAKEHMSKKAHELFLDCDLLDICYILKQELKKGNTWVLGNSRELGNRLNVFNVLKLLNDTQFRVVRELATKIEDDIYA